MRNSTGGEAMLQCAAVLGMKAAPANIAAGQKVFSRERLQGMFDGQPLSGDGDAGRVVRGGRAGGRQVVEQFGEED